MDFFFLFVFRTVPAAYGSSQARDRIGVTAASLCYSHRNMGSKLHLQPTPQFTTALDPLSKARNRTAFLWILVEFITLGATTVIPKDMDLDKSTELD